MYVGMCACRYTYIYIYDVSSVICVSILPCYLHTCIYRRTVYRYNLQTFRFMDMQKHVVYICYIYIYIQSTGKYIVICLYVYDTRVYT